MANDFSYEQLRLLTRIARHLGAAEDVRQALGRVLEWLSDDFALRRGVIALMTEAGDEVQAGITVEDIPASRSVRMRYRAGEGITGRVFATGEPVYLASLEQGEFLDRSGLRRDLNPASVSFFCVPILYRGQSIGTLSADKERAKIADPGLETAFLREVADLLAPFVQRRRLEERLEVFHHARRPGGEFGRLIGNSPAMQEIQHLIVRVADARTTVLLTGETGTGKGVVAELIHQLGPRRNQPFVEVNCGAIPETLIESELFGHEKGSFTGAVQRRVGVLERARGGTVFLDEIGELPASAQAKLLRVLQSREFERVGGSRTLRTGARIIAATNRDLEAAVIEGTFRSDLFYRLNVFPIHVPPLRERGKADIMLLVDHFILRFSEELGKKVTRIDTPAIDMLTAYHWPGNVRELENVIERAALLADGDVIHGRHLPPSLQMNRYAPRSEVHGDFTLRVQNLEVELITEALKDSGGNQTVAARRLGLTKRVIQYKIRKYGIDTRRYRSRQSSV
ncbi:MAG: GAF domain-containing protein [Kiritimatiellaeota bacterium]|nr:GAF domain-containing protein [Kiritimatiellota bacterium]